MKITLYYGSMRTERKGIRAAYFVQRLLEERGHTVVLIDTKEYELPLLEKRFNKYADGEAPQAMIDIAEHVRTSDALVVVSGEYNHGIPPALKNLIDHFMEEYFWKPAGIVTYSAGGFGGVRAAIQLRSVLPEVGMPTIPSSFAISHVQDVLDENGNEVDSTELTERFRSGKFVQELEWWATACKTQRNGGTPY